MFDPTLDLVTSVDLETIRGGVDNSRTAAFTNAAKGFAGGLACLGKFAVDGTPGTNTYDTYLAGQRAAHQF